MVKYRKIGWRIGFYHTVSPQAGYGSDSKPSKHYYGFWYVNMILDTSYSTEKVNKMDFEWFKLQIVAGTDNFLYLLMLRLREF